MKRISFYIILALSLVYGTSCSKDYLSVDRYDIVEPKVMFSSEEYIIQGLNGVYDMLYPDKNGNDIQQNWNFKPQMAFSNYPALDCQANGWDNEFTRHAWKADKDMFEIGWLNCYKGVDRANRFLKNLADTDPTVFANGQATKDIIMAEARAIRGFFYFYLAQNFGRVPMLMEGETYSTSPNKARAETVEETWNFVIADFEYAASILQWTPWKGEYGRITKGMAKAYMAQAYLYLKDFASAKTQLNEIIASGSYELEKCYGTIHTENHWWSKESVWEVSFPDFEDMSWGATGKTDAVWFVSYLTANPQVGGGWGALFISDEYVESFESGDKRKAYSVVARGETNPYTGETLTNDLTITSEAMPNNTCLKQWKRKTGSNNKVYYSQSAVWMRYAAVLLNYAECMFETVGESATDERGKTGWDYINEIRDRAWGNQEVSLQPAHPNEPIPLNAAPVVVPDAKTFYGNDAHYASYTAEPWKVALAMERRHEFLAEYSFWYDLVRTGMAEEYLNKEYPQNSGSTTNRQFDFQEYRTIYPIPYLEIIRNAAIGPENQNPGY